MGKKDFVDFLNCDVILLFLFLFLSDLQTLLLCLVHKYCLNYLSCLAFPLHATQRQVSLKSTFYV